MADTAVAITAGVGTNVDTRTESTNSNHRQVIVIGDPSLNAGVAAVKDVSVVPVTATDPALVTVLRPDSPGIIATGSQASPSASYLSTVAAGDIANAATDSGNPLKVGSKAIAGQSTATLVTAGQRVENYAGTDGVKLVRPHCGLEDIVSGLLANTDGASTSVIAAQGAGIRTYITTVIIANTSATAVTVDLRDGAAGSVKATFPVPANTSGVICNLPVPLGFTANTAVCMDGSAAATTVTVTLIGFKSKV